MSLILGRDLSSRQYAWSSICRAWFKIPLELFLIRAELMKNQLRSWKLLKCFITLVVFGVYSVDSQAAYSQTSTSFDFVDISGSGTVLLENCDDCAKAVEIGFPFTFYGRTYTHMYVSANGFVIPGASNPILGDRFGCCDGRGIPQEDTIHGVLAPWWIDLSMKAEAKTSVAEELGKVYTELTGSAGSYVFIIQYNKVRHFHNLETDDANTFQIKLFQVDNKVEFHYKKIVANNSLHTLGIESPDEEEGITVFRGNARSALPGGGDNFALRFSPPENVKLTSSLRYGAEGNKLTHVFEVEQNVADISDIDFEAPVLTGSITSTVDVGSAQLLANNPGRFLLEYELFSSLSSEVGGFVSGELIEFRIGGGDYLEVESQTVFIDQSPLIDDAEITVQALSLNEDATVIGQKSSTDLLRTGLKNTSVSDIFFTGRDPDTLQAETHQLTTLNGSQVCGPPHVDDGDGYTHLYALCETSSGSGEVVLKRFDLDTYLDDDQAGIVVDVSGTAHTFSGDIETRALVVSQNQKVAYARDAGSNTQNVYLDGSQVNSTAGVLKSLSLDETGSKLVYVLDNTAYFYDGTETVIDSSGVEFAAISFDGSTVVFNSTSTSLSVSNADASSEIFKVPASAPFSGFEQLTNLASGTCKLPQVSKKGERVAFVCDADLLALGNDFTDREAVFVVESVTGENISHLLTGGPDKSAGIDYLRLSADGAALVFEDTASNNTLNLTGLSKLSGDIEEGNAKSFPVPFALPGDGSSGVLSKVLSLLMLLTLALRYSRLFRDV